MKFLNKLNLLSIYLVFLALIPGIAEGKAKSRDVNIDFRSIKFIDKKTKAKFEDWGLKIYVNRNTKEVADPYHFLLTKNDFVTLTFTIENLDTVSPKILYLFTGEDIVAAFREKLQEVFTGSTKTPTKFGILQLPIDVPTKIAKVGIKRSDLRPGEDLVVAFKRIYSNGKEEADTLRFEIQDENPWFFTTFGMVFTNASNHEVGIVKTDSIVSFVKDGMPQQAYQQIIVLKDKQNTKLPHLRPLQSVVTFLNFQIPFLSSGNFYGSLGFPMNQNVFTEPLLGLSWYHKVKQVGYVATAGVHFHKEVEILKESGFSEGQRIDPTLGLTEDDVPTKERYKLRFFLGLSFRY